MKQPIAIQSYRTKIYRLVSCIITTCILTAAEVVGQSMSPPNRVGKEYASEVASSLTNEMAEQVVKKVVARKGLHVNYTTTDRALIRTYHYNFTNGQLRLRMKPKTPLSYEEWIHKPFTNGFLFAADVNGSPVTLSIASAKGRSASRRFYVIAIGLVLILAIHVLRRVLRLDGRLVGAQQRQIVDSD